MSDACAREGDNFSKLASGINNLRLQRFSRPSCAPPKGSSLHWQQLSDFPIDAAGKVAAPPPPPLLRFVAATTRTTTAAVATKRKRLSSFPPSRNFRRVTEEEVGKCCKNSTRSAAHDGAKIPNGRLVCISNDGSLARSLFFPSRLTSLSTSLSRLSHRIPGKSARESHFDGNPPQRHSPPLHEQGLSLLARVLVPRNATAAAAAANERGVWAFAALSL